MIEPEFLTKKDALKYLDPDRSLRLTMYGLNNAIREGRLHLTDVLGKPFLSRIELDNYKKKCHDKALDQDLLLENNQTQNQFGISTIEKTDKDVVNRRLHQITKSLRTTLQSGSGTGKRRDCTKAKGPRLVQS